MHHPSISLTRKKAKHFVRFSNVEQLQHRSISRCFLRNAAKDYFYSVTHVLTIAKTLYSALIVINDHDK